MREDSSDEEEDIFESYEPSTTGKKYTQEGSSKSHDSQSSSDDKALVLYIQMQLCESFTLKQWLENPDRKVDSDTNLLIFAQIVRGLDHIHKSGYMHRDLKPSNIFISKDKTVKIGDFGLAKGLGTTELMNEDQIKTSSGPSLTTTSKEKILTRKQTMGVGTAIYASPEQLTSRDYDKKADIYALGVILAEMYCQPFHTTMERHIN
jgi:serine/threonine protein kinase